ncbi:HTH-type transcriptional activator RhaS [Ensifer psoraleae]|uniref:helix-turn-helix transcriptional regulator n=1 Tax=Sinorhizobium psoraleae TaxID=520838 RepID=UPI001568F775|nr:AraC family transcriptional regulator [Sinorhizobium psoraleae]NRP75670.1 HTH-type transcriptional activator RhaS [Sinorhizobium psoraleae]
MAAKRDPIHRWREEYARRWLSIDFTPLSDTPFRVSVEPIFDDLRIARTSFSPGITFRDKELVKDGDNAFSLLISPTRNLEIKHRGRELRLGIGDATPLHVSDTGTVGSGEDFAFISVLIPCLELEDRVAHPDDAVMRRLPRNSEVLRLLRHYIRSLETSHFNGSAESRELVRGHIVDLASLALNQHDTVGESKLSAVVAARIAMVVEEIATSFHKPELSVGSVAQSLKISPRYVQRLLEMTGTSFTERVNELRLQRALLMLAGRRNNRQRISDIAFQVGFSDLSHFNRLFRARFGEPPSSVREYAPKWD